MTPRPASNLLTIAMALKEPIDRDWTSGSKRQTGTNLRVTEDTALANRLRVRGLAEVLQAPTRGRQPATGRPKYILKLYPNADAPKPVSASKTIAVCLRAATENAFHGIYWRRLPKPPSWNGIDSVHRLETNR